MAFEGLTEKFQAVFKSLRGKGRLKEADIKASLKEVKLALLEADVNFKVVKNFISDIQEKSLGQDVLNGLNPAQQVIKIVNEEMVSLLGSEKTDLRFAEGQDITIIMLVGLQGAGKTTTAAKLAEKLVKKSKNPLLVPMDIYRPAAKEQLVINAKKIEVDVFDSDMNNTVLDIAKKAVAQAKKNGNKVVIMDTAGRLHIDDDMMNELKEIKENLSVTDTILVVDAMTGQDAVNVSKAFNESLHLDGVILTKLDGDTRGGAALSIKAVTNIPILYAGMGEKLSDFEPFYPDRMASRILGMGDILSLIEKVEKNIDKEKALELSKKMNKKADFDFDDYLVSMDQMKKLGGIGSLLGMIPGLSGSKAEQIKNLIDDKKLTNIKAIIESMTIEERRNPKLMNPSRKIRLSKGSGVDMAEVNRFIKQFNESRKMMKKMPGMMKRKGKGGFRFPF